MFIMPVPQFLLKESKIQDSVVNWAPNWASDYLGLLRLPVMQRTLQ